METSSGSPTVDKGVASSDKETAMVVDEDDDVVIMEEEPKMEEPASKTSVIKSHQSQLMSIQSLVKEGKKIMESSARELELMKQELDAMHCDLTEEVYNSLSFLVDNPKCMLTAPLDGEEVDKMITSTLESLCPHQLVDFSDEEYIEINNKLNHLDKANQSVSKVFYDCHTRLREFKVAIASESEIVEKEIKEHEQRMSESCLLIDSEDEDDAETRVLMASKSKNTQSSQSTGKKVNQPTSQAPLPSAQKLASVKTINTVQQTTVQIPSMDVLRSQFANVVNKQMPGLISCLHSQQSSVNTAQSVTQQYPQTLPQQGLQQGFSLANNQKQLVPQQQTLMIPQTIKWPELKLYDKVFGKKFNDVWYPGTIQDINPAGKDTEWQCKVKFDGKGMKILPGRHVAYRDSINCVVRVGTRIIALYREDDAPSTFFAGVVAEAPSMKNNRRFLIFFDDGYAQYCQAKELHKVYMQSDNVWEDIHPDTSAFIKEYLRIYPERPMVRLSKGQVVKTEWNGKWWTAKVQETDASLVKMYFQADSRTEWIYRGSTRLEPLFKALANADAIKAAGSSKGRRHNITMKPSDAFKKPSVEYTRGDDANSNFKSKSASTATAPPTSGTQAAGNSSKATEPKKRSNVAKKSTGGASNPINVSDNSGTSAQWNPPWIKYQRKAPPGEKRSISADSEPSSSATKDKQQSGKNGAKDMASVLQERLASSNDLVEYDEERATGERKDLMIDIKKREQKPYKPHSCGPQCIDGQDDEPDKFRGRSSLLIPLLCGWERQVCKARPSTKRFVLYRAPCGRRLRCVEEIDKYLMITNSQLTIDLFCFDHELHVNTEFVPVKTFCDIKDLSYGRETYPISCVNGVNREYPDYVEYANHRIPSHGVHLNLDPDFLSCCDCTDNCRDRSKCACQQMTIQNTAWVGEVDQEAGYHYRRLPEPLFTGIVECNDRCSCDKRCHNRVAQQGLRMRLQVFKTEKKGWGLRCLDDIAKGSFICIYAGQLLTDKGANEDGKQYGDEYLAELDFIEVVERQKEGYESDVEDIEFSDDEDDANYKASKDSEEDSDYGHSGPISGERRRSTRKRRQSSTTQKETKIEEDTTETVSKEKPADTSVEDPISISEDDEDMEESNSKASADVKQGGSSEVEKEETRDTQRRRAKKSTGGSRFNLSTSLKPTQDAIKEELKKEKEEVGSKPERKPTRSYFNDDTECYIMDAKSMGNLGRYLNHSCTPNVFVQNIFVDTHDLRFPWVAFFAGQYIRAGTELTWDYNYEVGSVPDKVLYCYCGSSMCRGRLL